MRGAPPLRIVSPDATPEEVAAVVAAVSEVWRRRTAAAGPGGAGGSDPERLDHWRAAARLGSRRRAMDRGPWRLSGRVPRRARA